MNYFLRLPFSVWVRCFHAILLTLALTSGLLRSAQAGGRASVSLTATPEVILADGKSVTTLTATVRDGGGSLVADGTSIGFTTSLGTLDKDVVTTSSGSARVILTSASTEGTAVVTATSFVAGGDGSATGSTHISFTSDRDALFTSGEAAWIRVECAQYLVYSADNHIIEAQGSHGAADLQLKSLHITADALQLDLTTENLLARNALVQHGRHSVHALFLSYNLLNGIGKAIVTDADHAAAHIALAGSDLQVYPQHEISTDAVNPYQFADISNSRVIVSARAIDVNPGDKVQFRRATIYADGKKVLSVPFHVMPMATDQLFGQQVIGFGTQGFFVNIPYYYHVSPRSTGALYLRNAAISGAGGYGGSAINTTPGIQSGFALDLEHTYAFGRGGDGVLMLTALNRSEWGAHWTHTQRIDENTSSYFLVDYPSHRSLYMSSNVSRQFTGFSLNMTASGSRDPGIAGYASSSTIINTYLQTNPHQIGQSGINYVTDLTMENGQYTQSTPYSSRQVIPLSTQGLDFRFFTAPLHPDRNTSLANSFTVGQSWGSGRSAPTMLGTLGLTRVMSKGSTLSLNYTYRYDPLLSQLGSESGSSALGTNYYSSTQQRLALNLVANPLPRLNFSLAAGYGVPLRDSSLFSTLSYRINDNWGLGLSSAQDRYAGNSFQEMSFSLSRRIMGRDLVLSYSTLTKRIHFDIAGSTF